MKGAENTFVLIFPVYIVSVNKINTKAKGKTFFPSFIAPATFAHSPPRARNSFPLLRAFFFSRKKY